MGWYKKSSEVQLTQTVKKWLIQAYKGTPDTRLIDADLDQFTPSMTDEQSIEMGAQMAQTDLHLAELTTIQQGVLDHIRSRVTSRQQPKPQAEQPLGNVPEPTTPIGNVGEVEQAPVEQQTI